MVYEYHPHINWLSSAYSDFSQGQLVTVRGSGLYKRPLREIARVWAPSISLPTATFPEKPKIISWKKIVKKKKQISNETQKSTPHFFLGNLGLVYHIYIYNNVHI